MRNYFFSLFLFIFCFHPLFSQKTVGLLSYKPEHSFDGYNLFFSHNQPTVYLIDNCGQIVHTWADESNIVPGNAVYLLEDGRLVKCKRKLTSAVNDPIWAGGGGETVEIRDWDNQLIWRYDLNDTLQRLHHDVSVLPNGNVLMLAWELKTEQEAIQAGRKPELLPQGQLWPDYIFEVNPQTDSIIWEWHVWDHLVQDFDPSKDNYGGVAEHPELIDVNYDSQNGIADWLHSNALDYNADLDQIMLSVPHFDEIWIIDHSTTTEEAAGHSGGNSGKGGDLIYRWGNPLAYKTGTAADQTLFFQHDAHWIEDFISREDSLFGRVMVFNNRINPQYSAVNIFTPPFDANTHTYPLDSAFWGPKSYDVTITHPIPGQLKSNGLSSAQLLPNGNYLILSGQWGYAFELTPEQELIWEYKIPFKSGAPVAQGEVLGMGNNITFRMTRYPADFSAFTNRDLTPKGYIELEPDTSFCNLVLPAVDVFQDHIHVYPNPVDQQLIIEGLAHGNNVIGVYDQMGRLMEKYVEINNQKIIDTSAWRNGIYIIRVNEGPGRKVVVMH